MFACLALSAAIGLPPLSYLRVPPEQSGDPASSVPAPPPTPAPCSGPPRPDDRGLDLVVQRRGLAVIKLFIRANYDGNWNELRKAAPWVPLPMQRPVTFQDPQYLDANEAKGPGLDDPETRPCIYDVKAILSDKSVIIRKKQNLCLNPRWEFRTARVNRLYFPAEQ